MDCNVGGVAGAAEDGVGTAPLATPEHDSLAEGVPSLENIHEAATPVLSYSELEPSVDAYRWGSGLQSFVWNSNTTYILILNYF